MMNDNDDLPSAGMDPFATPVRQNSSRPGSPLGRGLIITGGLSALIGCVVALGSTVIQFNAQEDWEGFYAFISLCPVPCVLVGVILLIAGALRLARKNQLEGG